MDISMHAPFRKVSIGATLLACLIPGAYSQTQNALASEQEATDIARDAYIYGYPLILQDITRFQSSNVQGPPAFPKAPLNQLAHAPALPPADFRIVVRPNSDTLYSAGWLDLKPEPVVLSVAATDRYFVLPMYSMWSDVFAAPGSRTTGRNRAVNFLVVAPYQQGLSLSVHPLATSA